MTQTPTLTKRASIRRWMFNWPFFALKRAIAKARKDPNKANMVAYHKALTAWDGNRP
jgi:hypothetical protein